MDELLIQVSTSYKGSNPGVDHGLVEVRKPPDIPRPTSDAASPADALKILRGEPDYETLVKTLQYLHSKSSGIDIASPSAHTSQLVHALVSDILPNYWNTLQDEEATLVKGRSKRTSPMKLFLSCLRSVTGLNAILLSLKQATQQSRTPKKTIGGGNIQDTLSRLLQVISRLLEGNEIVQTISGKIFESDMPLRRKAMWNEFVSSIAGGKILGNCAEADDIINDLDKSIHLKHWVSDGALYSEWLAKNITKWAISMSLDSDEDSWKCCSELLSKSLRLGYGGKVNAGFMQSQANMMQTILLKSFVLSYLVTTITHRDLKSF